MNLSAILFLREALSSSAEAKFYKYAVLAVNPIVFPSQQSISSSFWSVRVE